MSTDSTELTFVRCPFCRSLVPAVSTRCRMCGAALDAAAKPEEEDKDAKKSGRVRQRTMSQPAPGFMAASDPLGAEQDTIPDELGAIEAESSDIGGEPNGGDDPLSAYIEEVEVDQDSDTEPMTITPEPPIAKKTVQSASAGSGSITESNQPDSSVKDLAQSQATNGPGAAIDPSSDQKQKVIIESGARKGGQGKPQGGLSFGRPRDGGGSQPERGAQSSERRPDESRREERPQQHQNQKQDQRPRQGEERRDERREDRRDQRPQRPTQSAEQRPLREQPERPKVQEASGNGHLVGWLVSYKNPRGAGLELREGKFFVTRSSLKGNDLILDDDSVSTPHAMLHASRDNGVQLQDLMSEQGVLVKKRDAGQYQRAQETVKVAHGDWVKFGAVEFLVSLVPTGKKDN